MIVLVIKGDYVWEIAVRLRDFLTFRIWVIEECSDDLLLSTNVYNEWVRDSRLAWEIFCIDFRHL